MDKSHIFLGNCNFVKCIISYSPSQVAHLSRGAERKIARERGHLWNVIKYWYETGQEKKKKKKKEEEEKKKEKKKKKKKKKHIASEVLCSTQ